MGEGREDASKWWHLACLWARKPVSVRQLPALWVELCSWGFRGTQPYPENALRQGRKGVAPKPAVSHCLPSPSPWSQGLALLTLVQGRVQEGVVSASRAGTRSETGPSVPASNEHEPSDPGRSSRPAAPRKLSSARPRRAVGHSGSSKSRWSSTGAWTRDRGAGTQRALGLSGCPGDGRPRGNPALPPPGTLGVRTPDTLPSLHALSWTIFRVRGLPRGPLHEGRCRHTWQLLGHPDLGSI